MNIVDATGSRWITAFSEDAEKILGMSAQELGELKENDNDAFLQKFGDASFKRFIFTLRAKSEVFQVQFIINKIPFVVLSAKFSPICPFYLLSLYKSYSKLILFSILYYFFNTIFSNNVISTFLRMK